MRVLTFLVLVLLSSPVIAGEDACSKAQQQAIELLGWIPPEIDTQNALVGVGIVSRLAKNVIMIDASIAFTDALGGAIGPGPLALPRDWQLSASGRGGIPILAPGYLRLAEVDQKYITATLCTRAVLYDDGTKEFFE